jgi:hypothetical protein
MIICPSGAGVLNVFEHGVIRYSVLKLMYALTIVVAGAIGLLMILSPSTVNSLMAIPTDNPMIYGVAGSVFLASALLSILGLRSPLKFVPVLVIQLVYKTIWMVTVVLPAFINGSFPSWATPMVILFAVFIVGDIIAIPFWTLVEKDVTLKDRTEVTKAI